MGEFILGTLMFGLFVLSIYLQASADSSGKGDRLSPEHYFTIVLVHYIGRFYRSADLRLEDSLDALIHYLSSAYSDRFSEDVRKGLMHGRRHTSAHDLGKIYVNNLSHKYRLQILIILFKIAEHENTVMPRHTQILFLISDELYISESLFLKIKAKHFPNEKQQQSSVTGNLQQFETELIEARKLLDITETSGDKDLKKSFRAKVKACHPDLNPGISPEKFLKLNAAYELIKEHRGMV
ncbi:MAG: J domain-containing protein [Bacteroidota bacterium]|nr:J domain-containing protein [Bacteroidota bacterium]